MRIKRIMKIGTVFICRNDCEAIFIWSCLTRFSCLWTFLRSFSSPVRLALLKSEFQASISRFQALSCSICSLLAERWVIRDVRKAMSADRQRMRNVEEGMVATHSRNMYPLPQQF